MAEMEMTEEVETEIVSIASLRKDMDLEDWGIEGLITVKSELRTFDRAGDSCGEMFCFTVRDETGDIEVSVFDHKGAHTFFNAIILNKRFSIKNCKIINKKVKYNLTSHAYELEFTQETEVEFLGDGPGEFKSFEYESQPIDTIRKESGIDSPINILGICLSHRPLVLKTTMYGRDAYLREIFVTDQSGGRIKIDLWDNEAMKFDPTGNPVVYLYGARLRDYRGELSLRTVMNTMMLVSFMYYFIDK